MDNDNANPSDKDILEQLIASLGADLGTRMFVNQQKAQLTARETEANAQHSLETAQPSRLVKQIDSILDATLDEGSASVGASPVIPGSEYPSLLTRLPIFLPTKRVTQFKDLDNSTGLKFNTVYGCGVRKGPPMTMFDEDVFIALLRLRQQKLIGKGEQLPIELPRTMKDRSTSVYYVRCSVAEILQFLELKNAGNNKPRVVTSVKNLAACTLEFEKRIRDRYAGVMVEGHSMRLLSAEWLVGQFDGWFDIVFSPEVTHWVDKEYTFINWDIRKQLTPLGKALHRYLSSQPKFHDIPMRKLLEVIGYNRKNAANELRTAFADMKRIGWIRDYSVVRVGKGEHKVVVDRV